MCADEPEKPAAHLEEPPEPEEEVEIPAQERIVVKLSCKQSQEPLKLRIGTNAPLERLFAGFRKHAVAKGWVQQDTALRFFFDGDLLHAHSTAADADLENDMVVEVHWS